MKRHHIFGLFGILFIGLSYGEEPLTPRTQQVLSRAANAFTSPDLSTYRKLYSKLDEVEDGLIAESLKKIHLLERAHTLLHDLGRFDLEAYSPEHQLRLDTSISFCVEGLKKFHSLMASDPKFNSVGLNEYISQLEMKLENLRNGKRIGALPNDQVVMEILKNAKSETGADLVAKVELLLLKRKIKNLSRISERASNDKKLSKVAIENELQKIELQMPEIGLNSSAHFRPGEALAKAESIQDKIRSVEAMLDFYTYQENKSIENIEKSKNLVKRAFENRQAADKQNRSTKTDKVYRWSLLQHSVALLEDDLGFYFKNRPSVLVQMDKIMAAEIEGISAQNFESLATPKMSQDNRQLFTEFYALHKKKNEMTQEIRNHSLWSPKRWVLAKQLGSINAEITRHPYTYAQGLTPDPAIDNTNTEATTKNLISKSSEGGTKNERLLLEGYLKDLRLFLEKEPEGNRSQQMLSLDFGKGLGVENLAKLQAAVQTTIDRLKGVGIRKKSHDRYSTLLGAELLEKRVLELQRKRANLEYQLAMQGVEVPSVPQNYRDFQDHSGRYSFNVDCSGYVRRVSAAMKQGQSAK